MENNPEPIKEILDELFSLLEILETQNLALTQFLKDQGIATDEKLAPYLDRAGNASSVKWRAARARMQYLLSPAAKNTDEQEKDKSRNKEPEKPPTEKSSTEKPSVEKQSAENLPSGRNKPESKDAARDAARNTNANAGKDPKPATPKPVAEDKTKKSETPQKSIRE
jgi:chemotaxis protein histidine kinase CheA